MAHLASRKFIVAGKPALVLSGEVHYFRLQRSEWEDRIIKTKQAGCNAVASYIPWLFHEEDNGFIDVTGKTRPERDLGAFIDLCKKHDLWFIARPGPYIMAEVKNEGIPHWIYESCPDAIPPIWDGKPAKSAVVRYNDPDFLLYVDRWYSEVMKPIASRLETKGGNVISVQLDNEIGMLQCWSEDPDLSEATLCEFAAFVQAKYPADELAKRYGFDMGDPAVRIKQLRSAQGPSALPFHSDYTWFARTLFNRFVAALRGFAEKAGVTGVPFIINIHGSGGGRATTFPIGIAQTYESYTQAAGYWGSSDHYLGELTRDNAGDLYMLNAFMAAVNRPEQPLSSVEFEAGTGDYGEIGGTRYTNKATDFKARLSVVQGNRMLNHYLIAGGRNPMLDNPLKDGNGRLGTTGERHGFAAPIGPEGQLDPVYFGLKDTNETLMAVEAWLSEARQELDGVSLGFIPDYYSTDLKPAGPMRELASKLEAARGWQERLVRALLDQSVSFDAVNLQAEAEIKAPVLALATSVCMAPSVATRLLNYVKQGGTLMLFGPVPTEDMEGKPMNLLVEALGLTLHPGLTSTRHSFPSTQGVGFASFEPEVRVWEGIPFTMKSGTPFLRIAQTEHFGGGMIPYGSGKVCLLTVQPPQHQRLWRALFNELNVRAGVQHDSPNGGVLLQRVRHQQSRFISLINLDADPKDLQITDGGESLFAGKVHLPARTAKLLPLNVPIGGFLISRSTAEIVASSANSVSFRKGPVPEVAILRGKPKVVGSGASLRLLQGDEYRLEIEPGVGKVEIRQG